MKLFGKGGKLNIIDIIILLVLLAALVFAAVKLIGGVVGSGGSGDDLTDDTVDVEESIASEQEAFDPSLRFTLTTEEMSKTLAESVQEALTAKTTKFGKMVSNGGRIYNNNILYDAYVTDVEMEELEEGVFVLHVTVEADAPIYYGHYLVGTQEVRLGKEIILKTMDVEVYGTVDTMEKLRTEEAEDGMQ